MARPLFAALAAAVLSTVALAQEPKAPPPDAPVDAATRAQVIDEAIEALQKSYVFPEVATRMADDVRARQARGEYEALGQSREFARVLTEHFQAVSRDKHLRVTFGGPGIGGGASRPGPRFENEGFEKVEKLPGNIGYVEVRTFLGQDAWDDKAAEVMSQLADTDALIVDLRRNGGGSPHRVAALSSYLFEQPTHLNSLYWREGDRTDDFWTAKEVKGKRFGQSKPVYVLTSKRTFSGAEEFAYNLKNLKRATIVGETTGGGAHPGGMRKLAGDFRMFVPTGRAISPITRTNWEGTGVAPDVATPADEALERAKALALKALGRA
jgi:hypothetical protein